MKKVIRLNRLWIILLLAGLSLGCQHTEEQSSSRLHVLADSAGIELPEELDQLDNVAVLFPDKGAEFSIDFQRDQVYLPDDGRFSSRSEIEVGKEGRVYIKRGLRIHAYEPDGTHVTSMGGSGKGPGEHSGFGGNQMIMQGNSLFTHDLHLQRINRFSLETLKSSDTIVPDPGEWEGLGNGNLTFPGMSHSRNNNYNPLGDNLLLLRLSEAAPFREWTRQETEKFFLHYVSCQYYAIDLAGKVLPELLLEHECPIQISGPMVGSELLPIYHRPLVVSPGNGKIYLANSDQVLIRIHRADGTYLKSVFLPLRNAEVDEEDFIHSYTGYLRQSKEYLRNSDLPESWPVLKYYLVDDEDRIWAATITDDQEQLEWWVMDEEGSLLANFNWPGRRMQPAEFAPIREVKNGYIYTYEETPGDEMDLAQGRFVRYRFTLSPR